jgi:hypothetical protein
LAPSVFILVHDGAFNGREAAFIEWKARREA